MMMTVEFKNEKAQKQYKKDLIECGIHPMNIGEFNFEDKAGVFHYTTKVTDLVNNMTGLTWKS